MKLNNDYKYTKSHEWVEMLDGGQCKIGISDYAQHELGDIVFVNLPSEGDAVEKGKPFADIESVKAVAELYSPVSGTVCAVNNAVSDEPGLLNSEPYASWIITAGDVTETNELLTPEEYEEYCKIASEH